MMIALHRSDQMVKTKACEPPKSAQRISPYGERRLKVSRTSYEKRSKNFSASNLSRAVPWIRLKGRWLELAGFTFDVKVRVRVMRGCLVITVEDQ